MVHEGRAALCGRPFPVAGRFPCHPVGEGLAPPAGFRNFSGQRWNFALWDGAPGRRALRAAWSAEGGRVRRPAPTGQFLSLRNQTGPLKRRRGGPLWPPVPGCGTFPRHPVGEGLAPPAGFRNFSGQRWNFALWDGAPGRRALRAAWSAEGGRVRRPAPTGQFLSLRNQTGPLKRRRGGPLWPPVPGCGTFPRHPVGEGLAPPTGFRNFPVNAGILPCEAAHQVVASYGRHGHRRAALCGRPSPVARRFPPSRRGGACPSRRFSEFFRSTLEFCPAGRRAGSSRPTGVVVIEGRADQETRPYGAISVLGDAMAAAATEPRLSLRNYTRF